MVTGCANGQIGRNDEPAVLGENAARVERLVWYVRRVRWLRGRRHLSGRNCGSLTRAALLTVL